MKSKTLALVTLLLVMAFLLMQAIAPHAALADASWTDTGGAVSSDYIGPLAYDSVHNLLYAGVGSHGVWKYDGTTWSDTGGAVSGYSIASFAYDSGHNLLYAGTVRPGGVWKYDGTTWTGTGGRALDYSIGSLAYDSGHDLLYAGYCSTGGGVWKYDGTTWTNTNGGVSSYFSNSLAYDSVHNLLYAGTGGSGVWKYNGATWADTGGGVSSCQISSLAYDSGHSLLYAGTRDTAERPGQGVWKYDGATWSNTGGDVSGYRIYSLAYDSVHNLLYAGCFDTSGTGTGKGVRKYDGTTWTDTGGAVSSYAIWSLAYDSIHNLLYAVCSDSSANIDPTTAAKGVWKYSGGGPSPSPPPTPPNFNSYIVLQNPNAQTANVTLTYMIEGGETKQEAITVDPTSRKTLNLNDSVGTGKSFSTMASSSIPIIAERPMYFDYHGVWNGGHDVVGATAPATAAYFAEGTTRPNFDPYFCIQNPGGTPASVTLTYMKGDGTTATDQVSVPANSRSTVNPRDKLGTGDDTAHDFSTKVTSDQPIIAERPIYFNYQGVWTGGHDVVGATAPATAAYFAEGTCRQGFDPYFCIQNPGSSPASVTLTYMKGDGTTATDQVSVPANSRSTVDPRNKLGTGDDTAHDFSTKVECTNGQQIIAERPMYFNYKPGTNNWNGGHDVVGATAPSTAAYFAEGTCRPGYDPYFCIQNPGSSPASVTLTYMKGDGTTDTDQVSVPANSRSTVDPRNKLGTGDDTAHDFSTKVECTNGQQIIAERPMYFNYKGAWNGGHDVVGAIAPSTTWYFAEGYTGQ